MAKQDVQATTADKVVFLLSLVPYLLENGPTKVAVVAEHFGLAQSQIRSLAEFLGTAGVPGETMTYQHEDLFDINWYALETDDVLELTATVAIDDTPRFSSTETAALLAGLQLLTQLAPADYAADISSLQRKLASLPGEGSQTLSTSAQTPAPRWLNEIVQAIRSNVQISFDYTARNLDVSSRRVDAHTLKQFGDYWYLFGYCHLRQGERVFRLEAMQNLQLLPSTIAQPAEPEQDKEFNILGEVTARIRVTPEALPLLTDWHLQPVADKAANNIYEVALAHDSHVINLVAAGAGGVEVLEPKGLRKMVGTWATDLAATVDSVAWADRVVS